MLNITGGGIDYDSGPYTVIVPAGVTSVSFDVPISDDNIFKSNGTFILTINSSSLPSDVIVGNPGQAIVTIVDDDRKLLSLCYIAVENIVIKYTCVRDFIKYVP